MMRRIGAIRAAESVAVRITSSRIEHHRPVWELPVRKIYLRFASSFEPTESDIANDTDDDPVLRGEWEVAKCKMKPSPKWILIRPILPRKRFAHDSDRRRIHCVGFDEVPSGMDRNSHRVE